MRAALVLTALAALAAPALAAEPPSPQAVQTAIDRAATWLQRAAEKERAGPQPLQLGRPGDPGWSRGRIALATFALLRSGAAPEALEPCFEAMRTRTCEHVYCTSLHLLALDARHVRRVPVDPRTTRTRVADFDRGDARADRDAIRALAQWLVMSQSQPGAWTYVGVAGTRTDRGVPARGNFDHSNVQFAVYALHAAALAGVDVPQDTWRAIGAHFVDMQAVEGPPVDLAGVVRDAGGTRERGAAPEPRARGWGYSGPGTFGVTSNMSAAGLSCLAMAREQLRDAPKGADVGVRDGTAWLVDAWRHQARFDHYGLYSVEKAFSAVGVEEVAPGRHWWLEGAAQLLASQGADGSWASDLVETSFALLFLNRATLGVSKATATRVRQRVATGVARPAPPCDQVELRGGRRASLSQTLTILASAEGEGARAALKEAKALAAALHPADRRWMLPWVPALLDAPHVPARVWARALARNIFEAHGAQAELSAWASQWAALAEGAEAAQARVALADDDAPWLLRHQALLALGARGTVDETPAVIAALEDEQVRVRRAAYATLTGWHGEAVAFDPDAPRSDRARQANAWRAWWAGQGR